MEYSRPICRVHCFCQQHNLRYAVWNLCRWLALNRQIYEYFCQMPISSHLRYAKQLAKKLFRKQAYMHCIHAAIFPVPLPIHIQYQGISHFLFPASPWVLLPLPPIRATYVSPARRILYSQLTSSKIHLRCFSISLLSPVLPHARARKEASIPPLPGIISIVFPYYLFQKCVGLFDTLKLFKFLHILLLLLLLLLSSLLFDILYSK